MALVEVNWRPDRRQLRHFGAAGLAVLVGLTVWLAVRAGRRGEATAALVTVSVMTAAIGVWLGLTILAPRGLWPFHVILTAVGLPIGIVLSYAALAVVYYGLFTPIALIFRLIGRDVLRRKFDPDVKTYWVRRRTGKDVRRYFRQF